MNYLLPLGSIVKITNRPNKIMIIGYTVTENDKVYEYKACEYPGGFHGENINFNSEDIKDICFIGGQDQQTINYLKLLIKIINKLKSGTPTEEVLSSIIDFNKKAVIKQKKQNENQE